MKRIVTDMDDVIADSLAKYLRVCNAELGLKVRKSDLGEKDLWHFVGQENFPRIRAIVEQVDFFRDMEVMPDAQDVIQKLMTRYEFFISSSAMEVPSSFMAKFLWLKEHFPFVPPSHWVFCGDKSILHADYLIDDRERHFKNFCGEGLLFNAPHNRNVQGYRRVNNWREVEALLLE